MESGVLGWRERYARYLAVTDLVVILWAVAGAHLVRASFAQSTGFASAFAPRLMISSAAIVVLWMVFPIGLACVASGRIGRALTQLRQAG